MVKRFFDILNWRDHVVTDPSLMRPTEIAIVRGNPAKALMRLGWQAKFKMHDVVKMMVQDEQKGIGMIKQ